MLLVYTFIAFFNVIGIDYFYLLFIRLGDKLWFPKLVSITGFRVIIMQCLCNACGISISTCSACCKVMWQLCHALPADRALRWIMTAEFSVGTLNFSTWCGLPQDDYKSGSILCSGRFAAARQVEAKHNDHSSTFPRKLVQHLPEPSKMLNIFKVLVHVVSFRIKKQTLL